MFREFSKHGNVQRLIGGVYAEEWETPDRLLAYWKARGAEVANR